MFTAALLITAKTWKISVPTDRWMGKGAVHIYDGLSTKRALSNCQPALRGSYKGTVRRKSLKGAEAGEFVDHFKIK